MFQELTEQQNAGVNPDYGISTPTLVAPPKGIRNGGHVKMAPSNLEIAVLKAYPFDSAVQRLTVITKKKGSPQFDVYVKGAPEKVASLCKPETSEFFIEYYKKRVVFLLCLHLVNCYRSIYEHCFLKRNL